MFVTPELTESEKQRALLERLVEYTDLQEQAFHSGDLQTLSSLSVQRAQMVRDAAPFVPPMLDWDDDVRDLALQVHERSQTLQFDIRACMAAIRRELVALTRRQQMTQYLSSGHDARGVTWQV